MSRYQVCFIFAGVFYICVGFNILFSTVVQVKTR